MAAASAASFLPRWYSLAAGHTLGLAKLVDAVDRQDVLGEINANVQNGHGHPLPTVS